MIGTHSQTVTDLSNRAASILTNSPTAVSPSQRHHAIDKALDRLRSGRQDHRENRADAAIIVANLIGILS